jgi:hypothetical protein
MVRHSTFTGVSSTPTTVKLHLALDSNDCSDASKSIGAMTNTQFGTGSWTLASAYGAGDVMLPVGPHTLTVCFDSVSFCLQMLCVHTRGLHQKTDTLLSAQPACWACTAH